MKILQSISNPGQILPLFHRGELTCLIGRGKDTDAQLEDKGVSREHAVLFDLPGDDTVVRDLNSTNHTRINGAVIKKGKLKPDDEIKFASLAFRYKIVDSIPKAGIEPNDKTECL